MATRKKDVMTGMASTESAPEVTRTLAICSSMAPARVAASVSATMRGSAMVQ